MTYGIKLSDVEITKRLSRLRNLERLHIHDRQQIKALRAENKQLRVELLNQRTAFEKVIQTQNARISELETMVFGRKPGGGVHQTKLRLVSARVATSYRRPTPLADANTAHSARRSRLWHPPASWCSDSRPRVCKAIKNVSISRPRVCRTIANVSVSRPRGPAAGRSGGRRPVGPRPRVRSRSRSRSRSVGR